MLRTLRQAQEHGKREDLTDAFQARQFSVKRRSDRAVFDGLNNWKDAKGTEIPQFLIERLSRNLFAEDEGKEAVPTPAESLAAAMLRSASGAKVKLGDAVELSFDPKGIKKLDKEA